jgi:hypothetical protein
MSTANAAGLSLKTRENLNETEDLQQEIFVFAVDYDWLVTCSLV